MKTIKITRGVERVGSPPTIAPLRWSGETVPQARIGVFVLTALLSGIGMGCDSYANKLKRDEAIASLEVLREEWRGGASSWSSSPTSAT